MHHCSHGFTKICEYKKALVLCLIKNIINLISTKREQRNYQIHLIIEDSIVRPQVIPTPEITMSLSTMKIFLLALCAGVYASPLLTDRATSGMIYELAQDI